MHAYAASVVWKSGTNSLAAKVQTYDGAHYVYQKALNRSVRDISNDIAASKDRHISVFRFS